MATNPFSASLQARPTYTFAPTPAFSPPPALNLPTMPTLPELDASRAPNALNRDWLSTQLANLPGKYNPMLTNVRTAAQQALAGYGGWKWAEDNPATPEREDLSVPVRDQRAGLGAREQQAVKAQEYAANARGLLDSSFKNKAVGAALGQLNEEAKAIVAQYAAGINQVIGAQRDETNNIMGQIVSLYGEDSRYLADNPPPPPPEPPPAPEPAPAPAPAPAPVFAIAPRRSPGAAPKGFLGGTAITWRGKPKYTPAQVENRWGKGARLVRPDHRSNVYVVLLPNGGGYATR